MTTTPDTAASTPPPTADWVDPLAMQRDPYDTYDRLRDLAPVVHVPALNRYLVTTSDACRAIESDQETYSARAGGAAATMVRALGGTPMLRRDDPDHATERGPVNPPLRPKRVREAWAPLFERNAETCLAALLEKGPDEADLDHDFAAPLAAYNLVDMLGLPMADPQDVRRWSHTFIEGIGNIQDDPDIWVRCDAAQREVDAVLDDLLPRLRAKPDGSITSALANAGLTDDQVRANVKLTISGGLNEPQHMTTTIVRALGDHPEQRELALSDPARWPAVFDEALRWCSPVGMYPRETTRPAVLEGFRLPAGAALGVVVAAANRDPSAFPRPADFDITRPRQPHLGFGSGVHRCAGHWAARIAVGEIAVPLLHQRIPTLRTDALRAGNWSGWVFRGLTDLPVTW
ncbi:cytochrome P450 [Umezawaea tangerina]|uniref:Cytochrome P450 n=1 Tax=Umezawaea tangerina TaxID=84725 RepID=A0A2T0SZH9_9PSEU|nr:cytochrome P450 [Umezawaea tangerina]PRY38804.1 hypothetical protein CLV43_108204 [Umezawaea tangerina]